ncbi:hypothetical protein NIES3275_36290 [Microchaete diplosiphon NIES-3275]|nr:hypothetical protein NIES3275_36290 [Microchaete diplosiphon NIES-3275]
MGPSTAATKSKAASTLRGEPRCSKTQKSNVKHFAYQGFGLIPMVA